MRPYACFDRFSNRKPGNRMLDAYSSATTCSANANSETVGAETCLMVKDKEGEGGGMNIYMEDKHLANS